MSRYQPLNRTPSAEQVWFHIIYKSLSGHRQHYFVGHCTGQRRRHRRKVGPLRPVRLVALHMDAGCAKKPNNETGIKQE